MQADLDEYNVLCVAGFGQLRDGTVSRAKLETHLDPIELAAVQCTYIAPNPLTRESGRTDIRGVQTSLFRPIRQAAQLLATLRLARSKDYDVIVGFSLLPYGLMALCGRAVSGTPAHLGIIGMDLDVHSRSWYGPVINWLFRRFDTVSVAGTDYQHRLASNGVSADRIFEVTHPVHRRFAEATPIDSPEIDLLWIGRFSEEKDPIRFVRIVERLADRGVYCRATMVGDGPLRPAVESAIADADLQETIDLTGWVTDPVDVYRNSRLVVLTSTREMLPLSVVEAMHVGVPPIAPRIGGLPDLIESGETGVLVSDRNPETYVDVIIDLLADESHRQSIAQETQRIHQTQSPRAVARSWIAVFAQSSE